MKRVISVWIILMLLMSLLSCAGAESLRGYDARSGYQYVTFGSFEQTADSQIKPILWRVLSVSNDSAYLCSEYVLLAHRVHGSGKEYLTFKGDFTKTEIFAYLNGEFLRHAFTEGEQEAIKVTEPFGRVYLLSAADLKNKALGFGSDKARKAWGTEYAIKVTGLFVYRAAFGSHSPYWTSERSTAYKYGWRCIKQSGSIGYINVITLNEGCRPVCNVLLDKVVIASGTGTMEDPYVLSAMTPALIMLTEAK